MSDRMLCDRRRTCGGIDSFFGPCGAADCATCHPLTWDKDVEDDEPVCEDDEPVGYRCVAPSWTDGVVLWPSARVFSIVMRETHGKAPSLYPLFDGITSGYYCYEERRFVLVSVYAEDIKDEDDEPTEEMTVAVG